MANQDLSVREIIMMIKQGRLLPEEGFRLIKARHQKNGVAYPQGPFRVDTQTTVQAAAPEKLPVQPGNPDKNQVLAAVARIIGNILHIPENDLNQQLSFKDMGVDSISGVEIIRDINQVFGLNLDAVVLYDYPVISGLADYISKECARMDYTANRAGDSGGTLPKTMERIHVEKYSDPYLIKLRGKYFKQQATLNTKAETATSQNQQPSHAAKIKLNPAGGTSKAIGQLRLKQDQSPAVSLPLTGNEGKTLQETADNRIPAVNVIRSDIYQMPEIAVIGMSGCFPGAKNLDAYWENLKNGVDCIREVPKERWDIDKYYDPDPKTPNKTYSRVGGFIDDPDLFDPLFFNISPREAEFMDPQQRLFLVEAWRALEDAGYSDKMLSNTRCGVFVGASTGDYGKKLSKYHYDTTAEAFTGLSPSILAARISYLLNLTGPSIALDTACSSSLVAIHEACRSILNNESDMAIAGGVRLILTPDLHIQTSKMEMLSPTGKCKTFDRDADGTVFGEGVGVVVLKPLHKALKDRDFINGVIKGSGINQDGKTNGITAPSAISQTKLELDVYRRANINPEMISYVEAHGTGTKLGDPIEIKALKTAFEEYTRRKQYCAIGTVKTNIGHTTMAAGVASVIKVILALKHRQIPPLLNFKTANEHIDFQDSPFYVNVDLIDWETPGNTPRLAAVSAFGFSGTNCHMIIAEAP